MNARWLIKEECSLFESMCNLLGVNGVYAKGNDDTEYMVVVAPDGAIRAVPLLVDWLEYLTDGWPRKEAREQLKNDLLTKFMGGGCGQDTPPSQCSQRDRKFFNSFRLDILDLMGRI